MQVPPINQFKKDQQRDHFIKDERQDQAIQCLQKLYDTLLANPIKANKSVFFWKEIPYYANVKGIYFWGGVGRGKTYLMDVFFDSLPFEQKLRIHFHRFMQRVHQERKLLSEQVDPLLVIADNLAKRIRVLCFDEFVVQDVADAVLLSKLLKVLLDKGVCLVATSNVEPNQLYKNGLQRDLFLPAIELINECCHVFHLDSGIDYRLRFLNKAETYFTPHDVNAISALEKLFQNLSNNTGVNEQPINIQGRYLSTVNSAEGIIWFDFPVLCDGPRSQNDYIEIAKCFHTVIISDIPVMDRLMEDQARRFIFLIDILYDHHVKLLISAESGVTELYKGKKNAFEIQRTVSRLQEMQSKDYLGLAHLSESTIKEELESV